MHVAQSNAALPPPRRGHWPLEEKEPTTERQPGLSLTQKILKKQPLKVPLKIHLKSIGPPRSIKRSIKGPIRKKIHWLLEDSKIIIKKILKKQPLKIHWKSIGNPLGLPFGSQLRCFATCTAVCRHRSGVVGVWAAEATTGGGRRARYPPFRDWCLFRPSNELIFRHLLQEFSKL